MFAFDVGAAPILLRLGLALGPEKRSQRVIFCQHKLAARHVIRHSRLVSPCRPPELEIHLCIVATHVINGSGLEEYAP